MTVLLVNGVNASGLMTVLLVNGVNASGLMTDC